MSSHIHELLKPKRIRIVIAAFAIVGTALLLRSFAATDGLFNGEAEQGNISGDLVSVRLTDDSASGDGFVTLHTQADPTPTPTADPTPSTNPTPIQPIDYLSAPCVAPVNFPPPPVGGMTYVNYNFAQGVTGLSSVTIEINLENDPGTASDFYLQAYDGNTNTGYGYYFGIQTNGRLIASIFGTTDTSNIVAGSGSYAEFGTNEGPYVSLRRDLGSLPPGSYTVNLNRSSYDGIGDWFDFFAITPGSPAIHIGSLRFPRTGAEPTTLSRSGGTWSEYWANNGSTLYPVPYVKVTSKFIEGKDQNGIVVTPLALNLDYSAMPNSDMRIIDIRSGTVHHEIGGNTSRCHVPGFVQ